MPRTLRVPTIRDGRAHRASSNGLVRPHSAGGWGMSSRAKEASLERFKRRSKLPGAALLCHCAVAADHAAPLMVRARRAHPVELPGAPPKQYRTGARLLVLPK
eukprot:8267916-Alexandrium_andersonii.AAC.1